MTQATFTLHFINIISKTVSSRLILNIFSLFIFSCIYGQSYVKSKKCVFFLTENIRVQKKNFLCLLNVVQLKQMKRFISNLIYRNIMVISRT